MINFDYPSRRKRLAEKVGTGKILLIGNTHSSVNYKDNWYPFRQDSTLLYYTGIDIPDVHFLMDLDEGKEILFGNELTVEDIIWTGSLPTLQELADQAGIQSVLPLNQLKSIAASSILFLPPYRPEHTIMLSDMLQVPIDEVASGSSPELTMAVIEQRNFKEAAEIDEMDEAVKYSYEMHKAVMEACKAGLTEHELVGVASEICYKFNVHFSYLPILTKYGEVLHNHNYAHLLENEDMVLFDGGCESPGHYAGDITRTFPVSGNWTKLQRDIYDIVFAAYKQSADLLRPGIRFLDIHLNAGKILFEGMKSLGFAKGNSDDAVREGAHTMFMQCGLGHMIGLDVHDMENLGEELVGYTNDLKKSKEFGLKSLRLARTLQEGFALTVEPGIYIIPTLIDLRKSQGMFSEFINYEKLEGIKDFGGIRIEDNFYITKEGSRMIGGDIEIPRTSEEVEDFML